MIKIRAETNDIEMKNTKNKSKSLSSENINKVEKILTILTKRMRVKIMPIKLGTEKEILQQIQKKHIL